MDKINKIILFGLPTTICNFRCSYCYLTHNGPAYQGKQAIMKYTPQQVAYALRPERLGGLAYMNFCGAGETLLSKNIEEYIFELVKLGHYAEIVTNATITPVIDKILSWDKEILGRISFKCSFHYNELKKRNLLNVFSDNVNKIWAAGVSANIEITPSDELIPLIEEVKEFSMKHFGALPHLSIARNDATDNIDYLTNLPIEEYDKIWSQFKSEFWEFKKTIFKKRIYDYCYAGAWGLYIDLPTGNAKACYHTSYYHNVFENPDSSIKWRAVGKCPSAHCFNGHALLTLGYVPNFTSVRYGDIRNRIREDDTQWIQPQVLEFFNSRLAESNEKYSPLKKIENILSTYTDKVYRKIKRIVKR